MKKAVVTFITNEKEFLYPPVFDFAGVDFLCFTDISNVKSRFWKILPLNGVSIEEIKNSSKKYLPQYEQIVFVRADEIITKDSDGGIKVVGQPDISDCVDKEYLNEVRLVGRENEEFEAQDALEDILEAHTDDKKEYPYKLTIGMLVGRKSPYFDKCFDSLKKIMKAIPESELIIVDTGNKDGSVDKVKEAKKTGFNITIVPFTWIYDFSAARNEAVRRAKGSWFMSIDDDEWFEDITALVDFFNSEKELYKNYNYAMYTVRNYFDKEGKTYSDASIVRLAKNRPDLCYRRRVHENFNFKEDEIDPYAIDSYVHHYGYLNNLESRMAKSQRNMALLSMANEEDPTDAHVIVQIIQEMLFTERYELAYIYALRGLSVQRLAKDFHIGVFVATLVKALRVIDKHELWNYENIYIKNIELSYVETAYVTYQFAFTAYETAMELNTAGFDSGTKALGAGNQRKYIDKAIEYSNYFETAFYDYNSASRDIQLAVAATVCDNFCDRAGFLTDMLIIRALAFELKKDNKSAVAVLKKIKPAGISRFPMEYYSLLIRYEIGNPDFYHDNENTPGIWMLFVQALLQNPKTCANLLKSITTQTLDELISDAQRYISASQKPTFDKVFEGLVILRLICEYMQANDYPMAMNAIKIALQGSEQVRAVAILLFEELKNNHP